MTSRNRGRRLGIAAAVAVFAASVAGCAGGAHPGAAAVVNGTAISEDRVDSLVQAVCSYTKVRSEMQGGMTQPQPVAALRAGYTGALVQFEVIDQAMQKLHLSVNQASVAHEVGEFKLPDKLDQQDAQALTKYVQDASRAKVQQGAILAHLKHKKPKGLTLAPKTPKEMQRVSKYLNTFAAKQDVTVNPAYGRWTGKQVKPASGSLSDPVSKAAKAAMGQPDVSQLPASQTC